MKIYDLNENDRRLVIDFAENVIMFNVIAGMLEKDRRLSSDEIKEIIHKQMDWLRGQV